MCVFGGGELHSTAPEGTGQRGEKVQLPNSLVDEAVLQSSGSGLEAPEHPLTLLKKKKKTYTG